MRRNNTFKLRPTKEQEVELLKRANAMLAEWWYWNHQLATYASLLKTTNDTHASKELRRLYRKRKR